MSASNSAVSVATHASMPRVLPGIFPGPPSWSTVFGRHAPLEVELGFGRPHFIFERAEEAPDVNIVGIEWKARHVTMANQKKIRRQVSNLCAVHGNAWLLFGGFFQDETLDAIYLNFPDPWWKSKHRKRRIVSDTFARLLASKLKPGAYILIQTDVASMLEEYLERLEAEPSLQNPYGPGRLCADKPTVARSHREKKCRQAQIPIFRGLVRKTGEAG